MKSQSLRLFFPLLPVVSLEAAVFSPDTRRQLSLHSPRSTCTASAWVLASTRQPGFKVLATPPLPIAHLALEVEAASCSY